MSGGFTPLGQAADPIQFQYSFRGEPLVQTRPEFKAWRAYHFSSFDKLPEQVLISADRAQRAILMNANELELNLREGRFRFEIWQGIEIERADGQRQVHWFGHGVRYANTDAFWLFEGGETCVPVVGVWDLPALAVAQNA